jgi:hypothetical protein
MKAPKINRGKHSNFYHKAGVFSLMVLKGESKSDKNILTFFVGENNPSSVIISREETAYVVRKIKNEIDNARNKA